MAWDDDIYWADDYGDSLDAAFDSGDTSWWDDASTNYWDDGFSDPWEDGYMYNLQQDEWYDPYEDDYNPEEASTNLGYSNTDFWGNIIDPWTGTTSSTGGMLGTLGNIGANLFGSVKQPGGPRTFKSSDAWGLGRNLLDAYMGKRENDRYNELMQPITDLYKAQAEDVKQRRANREPNIQAEYDTWLTGQQPYWDRRDQKAENLRQKQGKIQSSSAAWDRAANEQFRDITKAKQRQRIADAYDVRTGMLGGQLSGLSPLQQKGYLERQENPWLGMFSQAVIG